MENKINIAELLKDCPNGMDLDCIICNGVTFIELDRNPNYPIVVVANNGYVFSLTKYGQVHNIDDAKCVIFPQGKTTWKGFVPPCKFNINTLKPFDKVLVRGNVEQRWTIDFFGFMDNNKGCPFVCVGHYVTQCVPYEGNEHLLGITDDCDDYYKNWK